MSDAVNNRTYKTFLVAFLLLDFIVLFMMLFVLNFTFRYRREFKVDKEIFAQNVNIAVSNFLSNFVAPIPSQSPTDTEIATPKVEIVKGLSFYYSPVRGFCLYYEGSTYRKGDYCPYGLITGVFEDRAFCSTPEGVIILRSGRANSSYPPFPASATESAQADSEAEPGKGVFGMRF